MTSILGHPVLYERSRNILQGGIEKQLLSSSQDGRPFGHNRHGPKREGGTLPLSEGGARSPPHLTRCGLGRGLSLYDPPSRFWPQ